MLHEPEHPTIAMISLAQLLSTPPAHAVTPPSARCMSAGAGVTVYAGHHYVYLWRSDDGSINALSDCTEFAETIDPSTIDTVIDWAASHSDHPSKWAEWHRPTILASLALR